jgi:hypothetical protein
MQKQAFFQKSAVFMRYKKTVEQITGKENWNSSEEFYVQMYLDYTGFKRGHSKLLHLLFLCIKTRDKNDKKASTKFLNKLLANFLGILRSEGFEKES